MRNQWFIIQTLSGQENKVKESIEKRIKTDEMQDYIKEVLVPIEKVVEVRNQKKTVSNRKLWLRTSTTFSIETRTSLM